ncbi:IQ motif and ubiquitin-like domain-containing protein [Hetaerina americana]|uniref:IQ motif and ubiquitin-like domain-containing protein n=1 Tax=Hetaerina americana TaxID=62018 RepID=UPI003A7F1B5D
MLQIPVTDLTLSIDSVVLSDAETLSDFATAKCGTIKMNLHTRHYIDLNALAKKIYGETALRDVISVTINMGEGKEPEHVLVEIIKENSNKAFIGGYRHRLNGKEYHHVSSQTHSFRKFDVVRYERDSQTALDAASKLEGTNGTKSTQTPVKGLYLLEPLNIEITPREYASAKESIEKALVLQKYWRRWILRTKMKSDKFGMQGPLEEGRGQFMLETSLGLFHSNQRTRVNNFNGEMGNYKEVREIFTGNLKTYFNKYLLKKEIEHLHSREEGGRSSMKIMQDQNNLNIIKKFCRPLTWTGELGHSISVETEHHRKLSDWNEVYRQYTSDELSMQERRSLIMMMRDMLDKMEDLDNPRIQDLLSEQLDLLNIGVDDKGLSTLQKITGKYLLDFLEYYGKKYCTKSSGALLENADQVFACKYCKRFKLQSSFRMKSKMNDTNVCKSCFWLGNMSRQRVDYAVYRSMLASIQREEEKYHCLFSLAFMMQEEDIHYIVNTIWHGKSALSETKDVSCLRLCRFDNSIAWSPWNCFLLTEKEMRAHVFVDNHLEVYGSWLFEKVRTKHLMARLHFQHLWNKTSKPLQSKAWKNIKRSHNMQNIS